MEQCVISGRRSWKTRLQRIVTSADWSTRIKFSRWGRTEQIQVTEGATKSNEDVMEETTHCGVTADIAPHQLENKSVSSSIATWVVVRMMGLGPCSPFEGGASKGEEGSRLRGGGGTSKGGLQS